MTLKSILGASTVLVMGASVAHAGGLDRSRLPYAALFESGRYVELGFSTVSPSVEGTYPAQIAGLAPLLGFAHSGGTGNMAQSYQTFSFAYKADLSEKLSYGIFLNTPYGADALYSQGFYNGLEATWNSRQITGLLKYDLNGGFSVYGGLRYLESEPNIVIPDALLSAGVLQDAQALQQQALEAAGAGNLPLALQLGTQATALSNLAAQDLTYTAKGDKTGDVGFIIGAAYERPDIALRVGLTYEQGMTHKFRTVENLAPLGIVDLESVTEIEMPQSVTLDFQTGVAADTLLFGSIKWTEWSVWEVRPTGYDQAFGSEVTGFDNDVLTYQLGLGRKINDNLSVFARATYEKANGGVASRLSPTDGTKGIGIGATWRQDNMKITGGIEYAKLGNAVDGTPTAFQGNKAVGVGISVGFTF